MSRWAGLAHRRRLDVALLAALAYLPALAAGVGRMPADTKLYLYLDPARLVGDAPFTFDPRQFAGWVPHQTISYLWPSGPWYWLFEVLRLPDWIAHRLWIGTLLFVAGMGVRWVARMLGLGASAAVVAAVVYQWSPFVLPYLSRTSLMLLPWAALGWIVGLTVRAGRLGGWRDPALLALVIATVAAPNATAILMVAPAPVLWLAHAAGTGELGWRRATATVARVAALCVPVSLWWLAMLTVQGRHGADVLAYSETLEAVSLTSSAIETMRGMGYWLFYVRDPVGFTTSAAEAYMSSGWLMATTFLLTGLALLGAATVRFAARRYAVVLVVVGTVLAVGVHPIDDPSPLMSPIASDSRSTLALALRSSTRALPVSVLGMALAIGALAAATTRWLHTRRPDGRLTMLPPVMAIVLAMVNLPAAWTGGFVDPALERDQDPPDAWSDAAAALDALPPGGRVMQLPGAEFGAFSWGYTVDPPLPGMTERPLVTRDLLPLGSPPAMDLLYALDDRFQGGIAEVDSIAPVARLFGVDRIWVANDMWFDRFRTPRPELTADLYREGAHGLGPPAEFGEPTVPRAVVATVDETTVADQRIGTALAPVWLLEVDDPVPILRAKSEVVLMAGSGDGVVDAAAAGLIDGSELLLYAAVAPGDARIDRIVVTDSNRDVARHWRGSQDTRGFTEDGPDSGVIRFDAADRRLDVFGPDPVAPQHRTVARQVGPVTARASAYGEPFAYRPEDRPAMAIDGDPTTAWRVADRAPAAGEFIELSSMEPVEALILVQPHAGSTGLPPNRWITGIELVVDGTPAVPVELDESSRSPSGQRVVLPSPGHHIRLTVVTTESLVGPGQGPDAVGFAEMLAETLATTEVVRVPVDWQRLDPVPVDLVLTRLRADPTDRWRRDPEPTLVRSVTLPDPVVLDDMDVTVRLAPAASEQVIASLLGITGPAATSRLVGLPRSAGWWATDGDPATTWRSAFGVTVGAALTIDGLDVGSVDDLRLHQPAGDRSLITALRIHGRAGLFTDVALPAPDEDGWTDTSFEAVAHDGTVTLEVIGVEEHTTRDRRSAEVISLPIAVGEVQLPGLRPTQIPALITLGCRTDLLTIDGRPVAVDLGTLAVAVLLAGTPVTGRTGCDGSAPVALSGDTLITSSDGRLTGLDVDRVVARSSRPGAGADPAAAPVPVRIEHSDRLSHRAMVGPCPEGCWFVLGEGWNPAWRATLDGRNLGSGTLVDGGFNGWWIEATDTPLTIEVDWTAQTLVTGALVLSATVVLGCLAIIFWRRKGARPDPDPPAMPRFSRRADRPVTPPWTAAAVVGLAALVLIGPGAGLLGAAIGGLAAWSRRPRLLGVGAAVVWLVLGAIATVRLVRYRPFPDAAWPGHFSDLHRPALFTLVLLLGTVVAADRRATARRRSAGNL